ncbi:transmembrane amino acid transporter protein [Anaeramoeba flamelloides]|uniref:Transmembrane amino acid transporter protein n=1 Tax=Anaeramoeba flamelloides TaxID=1746091 RepID=A0AAV7ZSZ8_9EUKA|nr:transmembrane amino acid transporter protein [Anaeramoeba flamelloides]
MTEKSTISELKPLLIQKVSVQNKGLKLETNEPHHQKTVSNEKTGTVYGAIANLTNACMGAGILALPYAVSQIGWLFGIIIFILVGLISWGSLQLLMLCSFYTKQYTYEELARYVIGKKMYVLVKITILTITILASTTYLIIIGDSIPKFFESFEKTSDTVLTSRVFISLIAVSFGILPLSLMRKMDHLKFSSSLSFIAISYMVVVIIINHSETNIKNLKTYAFNFDFIQFLTAFPIFIFADSVHIISVNVIKDLKNASEKSISKISIITLTSCNAVYLLASLFGFFTFGDKTPGDIIVGYRKQGISIIIARFVLTIMAIVSIPIFIFVTRESINVLFFKNKPFSWKRHILLTVAFCMIITTLSLTLPEVQFISALTGSTASIITVFIGPGFLWYHLERNKKRKKHQILGLVYIIFGLAVMFISTTAVIYGHTIKKKKQ